MGLFENDREIKRVYVCCMYTPPTEGGAEEEEDEGASRVTMSYESKREVTAETRDSRATVDLSEEAEIRVSFLKNIAKNTYLFSYSEGTKGGEIKVSVGVWLWAWLVGVAYFYTGSMVRSELRHT